MPVADINSISIHYETAGEGSPVLLIHGLGSSTRDWERQVDALASSHKVDGRTPKRSWRFLARPASFPSPCERQRAPHAWGGGRASERSERKGSQILASSIPLVRSFMFARTVGSSSSRAQPMSRMAS